MCSPRERVVCVLALAGDTVVFFGKTLYSHSASLHASEKWVLVNLMLGVTL